ncbi:MAG: KpsF/GutQ family sugar-phosphate isomerase [Flavobacteriales bacterium]|nr:KpsF/GutQ family sugar-phosphate isomerase [Flavobacteriales bacterium]
MEVQNLAKTIDSNFEKAIDFILKSTGRVVITGIGKSAIVAQKIVATMNSTGTPALFMHTADAMHGDLGMIQTGDVIIMISKSGNTPEIKSLVPILHAMPNPVIAITSNVNSYMAKGADCVLSAYVSREVCPNNLAPTSSTTTQMVIGDAIAVALEVAKGFKTEDFARFHPGGALGKRLYMRVEDVISQNECPEVYTKTPLKGVISEISSKRLGVTAVIDDQKNIKGIITDGDIRRTLEKMDTEDIFSKTASDIMTKNPKTIPADVLAFDAVEVLQKYDINNLLVTDAKGKYRGVIHIHDLIREGIV